MIELVGTAFAVLGSIMSVIGALTNNLRHDHHRAMEWWMYSNILLLVWCAGDLGGLWNGGISIGDGLMCLNYAFMLVSGVWGLKQAGVW